MLLVKTKPALYFKNKRESFRENYERKYFKPQNANLIRYNLTFDRIN